MKEKNQGDKKKRKAVQHQDAVAEQPSPLKKETVDALEFLKQASKK